MWFLKIGKMLLNYQTVASDIFEKGVPWDRFSMKKSRKTIATKQFLNEVGVDVSPRPLAQWSTDNPTEEFERIFFEVSPDTKHKRKFLGSKHRTKSSTTNSISAEAEDESKNLRWYFETSLWLPPEPVVSKVTVILKEEGPFWFLDLTDFVVPKDSEEYNTILARNENYSQLLIGKFGSEKYVDRGSITVHNTRKTKNLQTEDIKLEHVSTQVSPYNFHETRRGLDYSPSLVYNPKVCDLNLTDTTTTGLTFVEVASMLKVTDEELMNNSEILKACVYVERILQFNQHYRSLAMFKNEPFISEDVDETSRVSQELHEADSSRRTGMVVPTRIKSVTHIICGPLYLRPLWIFHSDLTFNLNVSSISFNLANSDLLAAGYFKVDQQQLSQSGFVGCWSIKNLEHPERYFKTDSGVTAVAFSEINPFMLAVGFFNGGLSFYNVSTPTPSVLFSSFTMAQGHKNPVSALKWINKNGYEVLITTSTDGRILQWSFLNGLQCKEILRLKSMPSKGDVVKDQIISGDYDGGLCFDFSYDQAEIYLIGTDSGYIHKCSTIHANQYFKTYSGHIAPVYKIKWSIENPDIFASCSADMTIKIWHQDRSKALHDLLPINPPNSPAFDLAWCPNRYGILLCVFGTELQMWDLLSNMLDPIFIHRLEDTSTNVFTCLSYSHKFNSVFFGNVYGEILVHQMVENNSAKDQKEKDMLDLSLFQE